jgi:hypothetical protein
MIKINYPEDRKKFNKRYIESLGINNEIRMKFNTLTFNLYSLDKILIASFEELYILSLELKYIRLPKNNLQEIKKLLNYDKKEFKKFQPKIKSFFEKELKIKTCYFCNIDFVNSFNDRDDYHDFLDYIKRAKKEDLLKLKGIRDKRADKIIAERSDIDNSPLIQSLISSNHSIKLEDKYSHFTLDHVLDKGSHPLIALSLYNFVPSCYSCNSKFKGSKQFINNASMGYLSPTSDNFSFTNDVKFTLYFHNNKNISAINNINDFILDFYYLRNQDEYEKYINIFKLKGRYIFHKDEVINLIDKKKRYSQSKLNEISNIINISSEQIKKDIFGKELFKGNIEDVSMTKFKQDIAKNINLI